MFRDVPCSGFYRRPFWRSSTVWHEIFVGSNFCDFSREAQNLVPALKITASIFPTKIYSRVNILYFKFATQNTVLRNRFCSISSGFFRVETKRYTMKYWFQFTSDTHTVVLFENMFFYCTYSIKTKISSILDTAYFLKTNLS